MSASPAPMPQPRPSRQGVTPPIAPLGFAWRPLRVVPAVQRDHYWVASEHTPGQWYQVYLAILDAAHARCTCPDAVNRRGNRPDSTLCKHACLVVDHILDESPAVAVAEPAPAPAPQTSGSVMDVLRRRRDIHEAVSADRPLPFRPPVRMCRHCGVKPAMTTGFECIDCNLPF